MVRSNIHPIINILLTVDTFELPSADLPFHIVHPYLTSTACLVTADASDLVQLLTVSGL